MYTITAKTCNVNDPAFSIITDKECAPSIIFRLIDAFRDIKVVDEETGELIFDYYISDELFIQNESPENVIYSIIWG